MIKIIKLIIILFLFNYSSLFKLDDPFLIDNYKIMSLSSSFKTDVTDNFNEKINLNKNIIFLSPTIFREQNDCTSETEHLYPINKLTYINSILNSDVLGFISLNKTVFHYYLNYFKLNIGPKPYFIPNRSIGKINFFQVVYNKASYCTIDNSFQIEYLFPPLYLSTNEPDPKYNDYFNIFPSGIIAKFNNPTDEIELVFSTLKPKSNIKDTYQEISNLISKKYDNYTQNIINKNIIPSDLSFYPDEPWVLFFPLINTEFINVSKANNNLFIKYFKTELAIHEEPDYVAYSKSISQTNRIIALKPPLVMYIKSKNSAPYYFTYIYDDTLIERFNIFNFFYIDSNGINETNVYNSSE